MPTESEAAVNMDEKVFSPRSDESGDKECEVYPPIMLDSLSRTDDGSDDDTNKDDIGAIGDSWSDGSMLKTGEAFSLLEMVGSL